MTITSEQGQHLLCECLSQIPVVFKEFESILYISTVEGHQIHWLIPELGDIDVLGTFLRITYAEDTVQDAVWYIGKWYLYLKNFPYAWDH